MKTRYGHIEFKPTMFDTVWDCQERKGREIGEAHFNPKRQEYVFGPAVITEFGEQDCLDIADFLRQLNENHGDTM